ncbi:TetR/AcrR family transcriptional regulator [Bifidobacterium sp. 64T4]|uniref:TetR/AcrR family transcriptional regulator n=1 Tax=Bifidobacterium pongonis TaxID=2834432 RepID=UPI001C56E6E5|nr:TetR/AcrR family transcriptional regulator [Bifidobacterium pongonis]MBW3093761.1 TetR/AcrR family transcriptional regulator [Bifidobacterium pongonis]MBW3093950.1 TetR/AcrR family transcriptional regulator [Bifidobacterium pongonis]
MKRDTKKSETATAIASKMPKLPTPVKTRAARMREATDRKITQAILQIAASRGIGAVTIEEVARCSGVAKTTIYRRYRNTEDLLHKVQIEASDTFETDDFAPTHDDLRRLLEHIAAAFNDEIGFKAVGLVLSSDSDYVRSLAGQVITPAEQRFGDYIRRGMDAGAFRRSLDVKFLFSTVLGSMLACKALCHPQDALWAEQMAAILWPAIVA